MENDRRMRGMLTQNASFFQCETAVTAFQKIPMIIGQHVFIILSRQQINETDCNRAAVSVRLPNALMRQEKERFTMKGEMTQKGKEAETPMPAHPTSFAGKFSLHSFLF